VPIDQPESVEKQIPKEKWPWVGMYTADGPRPEELQRRQLLDGHWVRLGDNRKWLIPVARGCSENAEGNLVCHNNLPTALDLDDAGKWVRGTVVKAYEALWQVGERWFTTRQRAWAGTLAEGDAAEEETTELLIDFPDVTVAAVVALSANYRLGPAEAVLLELFTEQNVVEIMQAVVDWPTWAEWFKKKTDKGGVVIDSRWLRFRRWAAGRHPAYRPTFADLAALVVASS
jgi:hypothetical protein